MCVAVRAAVSGEPGTASALAGGQPAGSPVDAHAALRFSVPSASGIRKTDNAAPSSRKAVVTWDLSTKGLFVCPTAKNQNIN